VQICRWLKDNLLFNPIAAASYPNHSQFVAKDCICNIPFDYEENFVTFLNEVIVEYDIEFVIPTDDTIALVLTEKSNLINAVIVSSPYETAKICRYKSLTYNTLWGKYYVPRVFSSSIEVGNEDFPLFAKPDEGQGSRGARKINCREELNEVLSEKRNMVICEYLDGEEYTVDCFTDRNGHLLFINPRRRSRVQYGISVRAESVNDIDEFETIVKDINKCISFRGYWFVQLKRDKYGNLRLMELCTRFSGTFAHSQGYGVNLPLLALCDFAGMDVSVIKNDYSVVSDKSFIDRYSIGYDYSRVYIDYDDTITSNGGDFVNTAVMAFLYQCRNKNREIILLTRHSKSKSNSLVEDMERHAIPIGLFDQIIELAWEDEKSNKIDTKKKSIFIDNSFAERKKVAVVHKIPVFDVAHVECLYDWR
jgi:predicted ATP-grasp superfamily ATP-dependent carboligase